MMYSNLCMHDVLPNFLVDTDQTSQNYTFTFTLTRESSNLMFNLLIDSFTSPVPYSCNSKSNYDLWIIYYMIIILYLGIADNDHCCSFSLPEGSNISLGYHYITIQTLLDEVVYGETTERFFVFKRMRCNYNCAFVNILT